MESVQRLPSLFDLDKNYPSALCLPNVDRAIKIYLLCVKEAIERSKRTERAQPPWV